MGINNLIEGVTEAISNNPTAATLGGVAVGTALGVGGTLAVGALTKKRTKKRRSSKSRRKHPRHQKIHQHYGLREVRIKKRSRKHHKSHSRRKGGVHYTKNGQPYIILSSGKAKFIKKKRR